MSEQEMQTKIEEYLEEFEQELWREFEEETLSDEYDSFRDKFGGENPNRTAQELADAWKAESEKLREKFKKEVKERLNQKQESLIERYSSEEK